MKTENLTKYVCDCCGKEEYVNAKESSPFQQYRLPMKYYTETGRDMGLTNQCVDLCRKCLSDLAIVLSKHYELHCVAYGGVVMKRRADNEQRQTD
jgi:hypothetical protein